MNKPATSNETLQVSAGNPLLSVRNLKKYFPLNEGFFGTKKRVVHAVDGVSFDLKPGEVLGLVGESGCGKSTTGRMILRLIEPTAGEVRFMGENLLEADGNRMRHFRRQMQIIFQDPYSSLNPRMSVGATLEEPLLIHKLGDRSERRERVRNLLERVGL
ncbi:MAG TPA: ATP-binding cassette domain-containing protein, partial [Nitrospiria bacterium]|nr:ATP-binding cassette domain-containing protein [Nitrospiria bacterium]